MGDLGGFPVPLSPQVCRAPSSPSTRTAWRWHRARTPPSSAASTTAPGPSMSLGGWDLANISKVWWSPGGPGVVPRVTLVLTAPLCPDNVKISTNGSVISITGAHVGNQGAYHCVASNRFGVASSVVNLLVQGARWPGWPRPCPHVLQMPPGWWCPHRHPHRHPHVGVSHVLQLPLGWWCPHPHVLRVLQVPPGWWCLCPHAGVFHVLQMPLG